MVGGLVMADDCGLNPACTVGNWIAGDALKNLADGVTEGFGKVVAWLGTFWVTVDTPPLLSAAPNDDLSNLANVPSLEVDYLITQLWFWTLCLAVLSVLVGAGRMIWEQRGEPGRKLISSLITFTLITGGGVLAIQLLITASDGLARATLEGSTDGIGFGTNLTGMIALAPGLGSLLIIVFGVIALLLSTLQMVLMVFRSGLLVIMAGVFPTAAAFTNTEAGQTWFNRIVAWTIALILYKPAAALIYAAAFKLSAANVFSPDGNGGVKLIAGLSLQVAALAALPALMRLLTPMVGAVAGGAGGGALAGAAVGSVASGAVNGGANMNSTRSSGGSSSSSTTNKTESAPSGAKHAAGASSGSGATGSGAAGAGAGAAGGGAGAAAAGGGSAAAAGSAAGPIGIAAVAGLQAAKKGGDAIADAAKGATESSTGSTGSN